MAFKTADLCDEHREIISVCKLSFQSIGKQSRFFGPIVTVKVFEDNVLVKAALETVPEGSVLVVDGGGSQNVALMGDRLGEIAVKRKLAGVIINGCIRDRVELSQLNLGILALGSVPLKSKKAGEGERDTVLTFGDVTWQPGAFVFADEDGVIVAPENLLGEV